MDSTHRALEISFLFFHVETTTTVDGCKEEKDNEWQIFWPFTQAGSLAIQKCSGSDSIGYFFCPNDM